MGCRQAGYMAKHFTPPAGHVLQETGKRLQKSKDFGDAQSLGRGGGVL